MKLLEKFPVSLPNISCFILCWSEERMIWFPSPWAARGRACLLWLTKCAHFSFGVTYISLWLLSSMWTSLQDTSEFLTRIPVKSFFQHWVGNLQRSNSLNAIGTAHQSVMISAKPFLKYLPWFFSCSVAESPQFLVWDPCLLSYSFSSWVRSLCLW